MRQPSVAIDVVGYGERPSEIVVTCLDSAEATATKTIQYDRKRPKGADWMASTVDHDARRDVCACLLHAFF